MTVLSDGRKTNTLGEPTVLYVDDEKWHSSKYCLALENIGLGVVLIHDLDEAIDYLSNHPRIQLVITDLVLPLAKCFGSKFEGRTDLAGWLFAIAIRQDLGLSHIKIVGFSELVDGDAIAGFRNSLNSWYLQKNQRTLPPRKFAKKIRAIHARSYGSLWSNVNISVKIDPFPPISLG